MDIGVLLPTGQAQWGADGDPRELVALAVRAEQLGYSSLFVNDSLISPRIEALTMLAALAPATERVTLGTGALLPFLRRPIQAAQSLASIDLLSGGRLTVAVGAGFPGRFGQPFYELSEVPWPRRFARLDETVALWRELWRGATSFHGEILNFDNIPPATLPFRAAGPPIWLGGATPAALARTGRCYDGWLPYPPDPADYAAGLRDIHTAAAQAGRSPAAITPALFVSVRVDRSLETRPPGPGRLRPGQLRHAAGGAGEDSGRRDRDCGGGHREPASLRGGRSAAPRHPPRRPQPPLPARSARAGGRPDPRAFLKSLHSGFSGSAPLSCAKTVTMTTVTMTTVFAHGI